MHPCPHHADLQLVKNLEYTTMSDSQALHPVMSMHTCFCLLPEADSALKGSHPVCWPGHVISAGIYSIRMG